jgi:phage shock protein C
MIAGVCGGLGAYLGVDPVMMRLSFAAMAFAGGLAIPLYLIAWFLIPAEGDSEPARATPVPILDTLLVVVGGFLIAVGAALLPEQLAPWSDDRLVWVLAFVAIGMVLLLRGLRR